jgi:hypothetical protein
MRQRHRRGIGLAVEEPARPAISTPAMRSGLRRCGGATTKLTPKGRRVSAANRSSIVRSVARLSPLRAVTSMPKPPASETAAASSGGDNAPIPACWIGTVQPTKVVNRVIIDDPAASVRRRPQIRCPAICGGERPQIV